MSGFHLGLYPGGGGGGGGGGGKMKVEQNKGEQAYLRK